MAKPIPDGGKRTHQVKVNFNDFEIKKLNEYCKKTGFDKASVLRNGFLGEKNNYEIEIKNQYPALKKIEIISLNQQDDVFAFLDLLKKEIPIILMLNKLNDAKENLILTNFEAGAYALNAQKYQLSKYIYLFTPPTIKINFKSVTDNLDSQIKNFQREIEEFKKKSKPRDKQEYENKSKLDYKNRSNLNSFLWENVNKSLAPIDTAEYKHLVLGMIFLKYISDAFVKQKKKVLAMVSNPESDYYLGDDPKDHQEALEDRDYYTQANVFWVPTDASWEAIRDKASQPEIGQFIDKALVAIEDENSTLRGKLDKRFGAAQLEPRLMGELVNIISTIGFGEGEKAGDVLGEIYGYFLDQFASAEGKKGGQFYTPTNVVKTLVAVLSPDKGRVYDPCCGSGGMLVQSERFIENHGGRKDDISLYGQESNPTAWRSAAMNLAIQELASDLGQEPVDTFARDQHPDKKFDYILANPPCNISDWGGEKYDGDVRWAYGRPPAGNANFAWLQHILWKLRKGGQAGVVLANGSMSSNTSNEGNIREEMVRKDVVEVMVALPGQLFLNTQIPVCIWFLTNDKTKKGRNRKGETLFIDARQLGTMKNRFQRILTDEDISKIADTVQSWRNDDGYKNIAGFCYEAKFKEIEENGFVLTPGRYVGVSETVDHETLEKQVNIDIDKFIEWRADNKEREYLKKSDIYKNNPKL